MKSTLSCPAFRIETVAVLAMLMLFGPLARAGSPFGKPPVLGEKTRGIYYVAGKQPYVLVVFNPFTRPPHGFFSYQAATPRGKVFARWQDVPRKAYPDETVDTSPPACIVVNTPKQFNVVLKVYLPNYTEASNSYQLWVDGRSTFLRQDHKPPYRYGTMRLKGGRTTIKLILSV